MIRQTSGAFAGDVLRGLTAMPPNGALHGFALDRLMRFNLIFVLALLLLAQALLAFFTLRAGRPANESARRRWIGFAALVLISAAYVWMAVSSERLWAIHRYAGAEPSAMQVEVVGVQFQWYFRYPGADATFGRTEARLADPAAGNPLGIDPADPEGRDDIVASELVLPLGRQVDLSLRAQDVIHGFFIPGMRLKQDAIPGMAQHVHFTPVRLGEYPIVCSQLCGIGHQRMNARLRVVSPNEYAEWLHSQERMRLAQEAGY